MTMDTPDIDHLRQWIGRGEEVQDAVTERLAASLNATLDRPLGGVPLGLHWCLTPNLTATKDLAADGLPSRGGLLPPVPLPLRMWAGGRLEFLDALQVGDAVIRRSRVSDISLKEGRSGRLCFVAVSHDYVTQRGLAVRERHDIVYRSAPTGPASKPKSMAMPKPAWTTHVMANAVLLFRYSALTFNGHRIHFDRDYCRDEEGYDNLLVHGPLQATFLMNFAADIEGRMPRVFDYRALMPLYDGAEFSLNGARSADGLTVWAADGARHPTLQAEVRW